MNSWAVIPFCFVAFCLVAVSGCSGTGGDPVDASAFDASVFDARPSDGALIATDAGAACEYRGQTIEDGESVCDNPGQSTACLNGELAQGECIPGLVCIERENQAQCECNETANGYCPELTDTCNDLDPDC